MRGIALNQSVDGLAEEVSSQRKAGRRCFNGGLCTLPPEHHPTCKEHRVVVNIENRTMWIWLYIETIQIIFFNKFVVCERLKSLQISI